MLGREDGLWGPDPNGGGNWVSLDGVDGQDRYTAAVAQAAASAVSVHMADMFAGYDQRMANELALTKVREAIANGSIESAKGGVTINGTTDQRNSIKEALSTVVAADLAGNNLIAAYQQSRIQFSPEALASISQGPMFASSGFTGLSVSASGEAAVPAAVETAAVSLPRFRL